jgi:tRNA(Ile)-lysidine synthase
VRADKATFDLNEINALLSSLEAATGIVAGVSGGPDSSALMHCLAHWREHGSRPSVVAATVDHGLRPGSAAEAERVAAWAAAAGLPHRILTWEGPKPRSRVQEVAREERYRRLAALAREVGASHLVTGHTLDDQAETVVMRLLHGTGIGGLAGMRPETAREGLTLVRPFLALRKGRLVAACRAEGWPFLEDPSNADPRFARTRLRRDVMPALLREGLTPERLAVLAERARRDADALHVRAVELLATAARPDQDVLAGAPRLILDGTRLRAEPDAVLLRVMARAIAAVAGALTRPVRLERLEARVLDDLRPALDRGEALRMTLGGTLIELKADGRLVVRPEPPRRRGGS